MIKHLKVWFFSTIWKLRAFKMKIWVEKGGKTGYFFFFLQHPSVSMKVRHLPLDKLAQGGDNRK